MISYYNMSTGNSTDQLVECSIVSCRLYSTQSVGAVQVGEES